MFPRFSIRHAWVLAILFPCAARARESMDDLLLRLNESGSSGSLEETVAALSLIVRRQQQDIDELRLVCEKQAETIQRQEVAIELLGRRVTQQEASMADQNRVLQQQGERIHSGLLTESTVLQAVEELETVEFLYRQAEETRTTAIFDVAARDKERYFRRAAELFERIADRYPNSPRAPDAAFQAAKIHRRWLDDREAAIDACQRIVSKWPEGRYSDLARDELAEFGLPSEP